MSSFGSVYTLCIRNCKLKRWDNLDTDVELPSVRSDLKILARATFDAYHRERNEELSVFTARLLENNFTTTSLKYGRAHLGDFASAHRMARDEVKDKRIADRIVDFVKKNEETFGLMLAAEDVEPWVKTQCLESFPFLSEYRKDKVEPETPIHSDESSTDPSTSSSLGVEPPSIENYVANLLPAFDFPPSPARSDDGGDDQDDASTEVGSDASTIEPYELPADYFD